MDKNLKKWHIETFEHNQQLRNDIEYFSQFSIRKDRDSIEREHRLFFKIIDTRNSIRADDKDYVNSMNEIDLILEDIIEDDGTPNFNRPGYLIKDLLKDRHLEPIIKIIELEQRKKYSKGGRKPKLTTRDKVIATINYLAYKKTYLELAKEYGIHESNMYDNINEILNILKEKNIIFETELDGTVANLLELHSIEI